MGLSSIALTGHNAALRQVLGSCQKTFGRFEADNERCADFVRTELVGDVREAVQVALPASEFRLPRCDDPGQVLVPHFETARDPAGTRGKQLVHL